jgi:folylpolyglutamate synthase/dihydropteroate synthase
MVFGASEDKDKMGMFAELLRRITKLVVTQSIHLRAMSAVDQASLANEFNPSCEDITSIEDAFYTALIKA